VDFFLNEPSRTCLGLKGFDVVVVEPSRRAADCINKEEDIDWAYNGTIESNTLRLRQLSQQHAADNMCKQQQRQPYQHQPL